MPVDASARKKLDVLLPTFERPEMLGRALDSLLAAPVPPGLAVHITVIQNGEDAETAEVIRRVATRWPDRVSGFRGPARGKAASLNAAIARTDGELVGIVDDDEEIDPAWYCVAAAAFENQRVDFIGGPCLPRWGAEPPAWLPRSWRGVIGFVDDGDEPMVFGKDAPGILMGGNAVLRRSVLLRVGCYAPLLGPRPGRRLLSGEDEELYRRLLAAGAHGLYLPGLKIYHYVPPERLTKRYCTASWSFWHGVSRSIIDRLGPLPVRRIGRVPRYVFGAAARALVDAAPPRRRDPSVQFAGELALWHAAGFVYGTYLYKPEAP